MKKSILFLFLCFILQTNLTAQEYIFEAASTEWLIRLENPSFEGTPMVAKSPESWDNCGFKGEFASDILPGYRTAFFGVNLPAAHGDTYVGMVMRGDSTWESIAQKLDRSFEKDTLYKFSVFAAQSEVYTSISRSSNLSIDYITPGVLRVWGGKDACDHVQLLGQTELINHFDWFEYTFEFKAEGEWDYLTLEAYYDDRRSFPYAGHILVDHCSEIRKIDKFKTVLKPADLTVKNVKELTQVCKSNNITETLSGESLVHTKFLNTLIDYENLPKGMGIQQFILNTSVSDLSVTIRCLDKLGAKKSVALIRKLTQIYLKNKNGETRTEAEMTYFDNATDYFEEKLLEDDFNGLLKNYIHRNKEAIAEELEECSG